VGDGEDPLPAGGVEDEEVLLGDFVGRAGEYGGARAAPVIRPRRGGDAGAGGGGGR